MLDEKKLKKIVRENKPYLEALREFDRTGKLRKVSYKERANFTIDGMLLSWLRSYCRKNRISMSGRIESLIEEYRKQVKKI